MFKNFGMSQLISDITRPVRSSGSCIDWIVTNCKFVKNAYVLNVFLSDHYATECIRKKVREHHDIVYRTVRSYTNYNKEIFLTLLRQNLSRSDYDTLQEPNAKWDLLYSQIYDLITVMCPLKKYRQRESITPWITPEIYRNIRYRNSLVNLYNITKNNLYLNLMRQQRNVVNSMIDSAKKAYISTLLDNNSTCPKKFWKLINQFLKGNHGVTIRPKFVDPDNSTEVPMGDEAEFLNNYFCNISQRLGFNPNDQVTYSNNDYLNIYDNIDNIFDLSADPILVDELLSCSDDIDLSKNCCVPGLTSQICKDLITGIPVCFVSLFNLSIKSQVFPESWAKGTVILIPKSGDLTSPSNWQPITQTSIFAKIMEKLVHRRVFNYITECNILTQYQYGFRPGKSTQIATFDLLKYIYSGLNHKKVIGSVCLDIAKAFDCINHDILLYKFRKIGFSENTIGWFKSYLTRTQVVKFDNELSSSKPVITGIGQGTILGPLLFIFYINDIISVVHDLKINMYADDCMLYISGNDWNRMKLKIQPELCNVQQWCTRNRLKLNVSKSKVLLISSRHKLSNIDRTQCLLLGDDPIAYCDKYKYLGITLDSEMTLTNLLSDTKRIVSNRLFNLRKLRRYIAEKAAISIYKSTILPVFDYPGYVIISCNKSDRHDLQIMQNDALRTCFNVKRRDKLSISKMHKKAKLLSLEQRRSLQLLYLMFQHKTDVINLRRHNRNTRAAARDHFYVERYNNVKYKNSPFFKGSELWDELPNDIIACDSIFQFKKKLKCKYTIYCDTIV